MFYLGIENQLSFIILLLFSFYIFAVNMSIDINDKYYKIFGHVFIVPIFILIASFISVFWETSYFLFFIANILTIFSIIIIPLIESNRQFSSLIIILYYVMGPAIVIINAIYAFQISQYIKYLIIGIMIITSLLETLVFYQTKKEKYTYPSLGAFLLSISVLFSTLNLSSIFIITILLCSMTAFSFGFHKYTYGAVDAKYKQAIKHIKKLDEDINREVRKRTYSIEQSNEKLVTKSKTDGLTKALTKNAIIDAIDSQIRNKPLKVFSILMYDVDEFKTVNDTLGHVMGDKCLKVLSRISKQSLRSDDFLGRYGGDEFIIMLSDAAMETAISIADRIRGNIESKSNPKFTVSIGVASYPDDAKNTKSLIHAADQALYRSKENGRNQVNGSHLSSNDPSINIPV